MTDSGLVISGLRAGYGKVAVLRDVDVAVRPGEIVALLGPNGGGKSTSLRAGWPTSPRATSALTARPWSVCRPHE